MTWESAERVQKNSAGEYRALIGGEWVPVARAQKNSAGEFRVERIAAAPPAAEVTAAPRRGLALGGLGAIAPAMAAFGREQQEKIARTGASVTAGMAAGPALAVGSRALGAAAPALQRVTTPLATAFETGGFQSGLASTAPRAARLATRAVGGAVPGAIGGAVMSPDEAATGAAFGAGFAFAAPALARIASKGAGAIADAVMGRTADVRANQLVRLAANDEVNALRQAMAAQPDVPASRAAAELDMPMLQALLAEAEKKDPRGVVNAFRQRESQDTLNELSRIAGGPTAETARAARESAKESLTAITTPMREKAFGAARKTGEVMPRLAEMAPQARTEAAEAVDRVRRFVPAIKTVERWADAWSRGGRTKEDLMRFPKAFAQRADEAAQESLRAGGRARAAENTLQSMKDRGLKPITAADLTGPISRQLQNPDIATNREASAALTRINQMLGDWENEFGIVTPEALYAIRKNGVAGVIRDLNPGMDAKSQQQLAASVLTKVKPLFDDAIENAGGKEFKDYLTTFERGMSDIRGMELADQIRTMYKAGEKQKIIDLVAGESPQVVEDLFGSGRFVIGKEMAKDMPLLRKIADTAQVDLKVAEQAAAGRASLKAAEDKAGWRMRLPFFTRFTTATNEIIAALERKTKAQTMEVLIRAAQSGREFNRVLDAIPTKERSAFLAQFKNAESWNKFSTQVANAARAYTVAQQTEQE